MSSVTERIEQTKKRLREQEKGAAVSQSLADRLAKAKEKYGGAEQASKWAHEVAEAADKSAKEQVRAAMQSATTDEEKPAKEPFTMMGTGEKPQSGGNVINALDFLKPNSSVKPSDLATGKLTSVGAKAEHQAAGETIEKAKEERKQAFFDPSARNPESENFKTDEERVAEIKTAEDKQAKAAQNYYDLKGKESVSAVLQAGQTKAFGIAVDAAVEALGIHDTYRNGGWNNAATSALMAAHEKQARAIELMVKAGISKETAERAVEYQAQLVRAGKAQEKAQATQQWADEHPVAASIQSVVSNPTQGMDYLNALAKSAGHSDTSDLDTYRPLSGADFQNTAFTQALREGASADMGKVGKFLYDVGMSGVDSFVLANTVGPATGVLLGMGAASSTAKDALARGATNNQALSVGFAAGAAEMIFETLSVDRLLKLESADSVKALVTNALKQAGTEGLEEFNTEIANIIMDSVVMGQNSNFNTAVKAYRKQGMSEEAAKRKAFLDNLAQVGLAAAGGFLTGGVMGGAQSTPSFIANRAYQDYLSKTFSQDRISMLSVAQAYAEGSQTRAMADGIYAAVKNAMDANTEVQVSENQWGRLIQSMENEKAQFGPKLEGGATDPTVEQTLHPDEAVMSPSAQAFMDAGDDARTADAKSQIFDRIRNGDTTLRNADLRVLDLDSAPTRAAFKNVLGVELPPVIDSHALNRAARNAAKAIADARAQAQAQQAEIQARVEESQQVISEAEQQARAIEAEAAEMAKQIPQLAEAEQGVQAGTAVGTDVQERSSLGEIPTTENVPQTAVSEPVKSSSRNLLDYVGAVHNENATVRERTQNMTVQALNQMLESKSSRARVELVHDGKDGFNAMWTPDGKIQVNADKLNTQFSIHYTLTHELFHEASKQKGGEESEWTRAAAKELIALAESGKVKMPGYASWEEYKSATREAQIRAHNGAELSEDFLNEEYAADVLRSVFAQTGNLKLFAREHRTTLTKIRDWLQSRFTELLKGGADGKGDLMTEMNDLVKKVNDALTNTAERGTDKAETTTAQEGKYSVEGREKDSSREGDSSGRLREPGARPEDSGDVPGRGVRPELGRDSAQMADRGVRLAPGEEVADEAKGRSARNERVESREDFLDRAKRAGKKIRIIKGAAVAYRDVPLISASKAARQAVRTAKRLGETDAIVFSGSVEFNHNGVTGYPSRQASTIGKEMIAFSDSLTMPPVEAAAHEVAHKWMGTDRGKQYMGFVLSQYVPGTKFEQELREAYKPEKVDEEKVAYLSGWMEDGFSDAKLSRLVSDPVAVRKAWESLKSDMRSAKFSASTADINTPEFRAWFHDDSGELTNPDGTPKIFLRGDSFSGATRFPDGADNYSGGIFFSTKRDVADNYAEMNSSLGGLGVYSEEFVPKHLANWNDAFLWVESGALGPLVALARKGPEWKFMTRTYDPDAELNGMKPFSKWKTVASYPNTAAGLEQFNAEYGELMSGGKIQNPGFMRTYLTAQNTLVVDAQGRGWTNVDGRHKSTNETVTEAWEKGYDCVVIKNVVDGGTEGEFVTDEDGYEYYRQVPIDVTVVRDSGQVKSVYNTGSFDRGNPDVRYSVDGKTPFREQVHAALTEDPQENRFNALYIAETPNLLAEVGLGDLPMCMTASHVRDINHQKGEDYHWHGIPEGLIARLPELLSQPAMILSSDTRWGDVVVATAAVDNDGNPVLVSIRPNGSANVEGVKGPANFITSMYGKDRDFSGWIERNAQNGRVLYWDRKRTQQLFRLARLQLPAALTTLSSDTILKQHEGYVKEKIPERRFSIGGKPLADPLYSQMERVLNEYKGEKIGATSLISYLKNHGVKQEEIKWSGIEQFLEGKKSVTKDELFEFLRANELVIEDVVLSNSNTGSLSRDEQEELAAEREKVESAAGEIGRIATEHHLQGVEDEYRAMMMRGDGHAVIPEWFFSRVQNEMYMTMAKGVADREAVPDRKQLRQLAAKNGDFGFDTNENAVDAIREDPAAFARNHQMSESDKEILLDYAEKKARNKAASEAWVEENKDAIRSILDLTTEGEAAARKRDKLNDLAYQRSVRLRPKYDRYAAEPSGGRVNYREVLFRLPEVGGNLDSPHWAQTDVLAHTRLQDMVDAEGKKVLFVDEVQSDWHQAGRDDGYTPKEMSDFLVERGKLQHALKEAEDKMNAVPAGPDHDAEWRAARDEYDAAYDAVAALNDRYHDFRAKYGFDTVPDAPYRDTWHEYVLKRVLRMAAEGGYDKVAWTTGQMQADRYGLQRQLHSIEVAGSLDDEGQVTPFYDYTVHLWGGQVERDFMVEPAEMTEMFGHDLGKRLMAAADEKPGGIATVEGEDLTIGGEGMKNFYDVGGKSSQNIPKFLNKYLKPWGVKVQSSLVGKDLTGSSAYRNGGMEEVMRIYQSGMHNMDDLWLVPGVDITDQMRDDLLYKGQPRYSVSGKPSTGGSTGNVNPDTGFERGSVADSFMRMWNVGAQDEALSMLESVITRLAQLEADASEHRLQELRRAVLAPRVTESAAERNRARIERLIAKYGMMPQTSAAQQEVRLPEQIDDKTHVAGAVQTVMAAGVTNELIRDELVQDVLSGNAGVTYARIGDRATLEQVDKEYEKHGFDPMMRQWKAKFNGNESIGKLDIARAEKLYVEMAGSKDPDVPAVLELVAEIAAAGTQAGQAVQAMTLLKKMTPTGQLYYIQKAVDRLNRDPRQKSPITLNEKLAEKLVKAQTRAEINAAIDELINDIAQQVPVSLADKWNTWRYFAMLGNPRTHIRNLLGNAIFAPARLAKDALGVGLEHLFIRDSKQRTKALTANEALREFAEQDAVEMQDILRGGGKYNPSDMIRDKRKIFKRAEWLNTLTQKNSELLEKEDWIFLGRAYQRALAGFLSARGVTDTDSLLDTAEGRRTLNEARAYAVHEAQRATYRDMSKLAGTLNHLKRNHKALGIFLDGIVPFTKTPINIVKRGVEYSPIGLAKTIYDAVNRGVAVKQIEKGKTVKRDFKSAAEVIDELSANLTGTGVALLGAVLSHLGLLTAGLGSDDEDKFKELYGEQAYSLSIPGVGSYTIDWTAPVALPLFVGAEIYNTLTADYSDVDAEQVLDAVMDGMASILEPMLSLSMLDGLNDALSANKFGDSEDALWTLLSTVGTSYVAQGVPTIMGQLSRTIDPDRRTTFIKKGEGDVKGMLKRFWQSSVQGKIPFYENEKMAYVDAWGRTDTTGSIAVRAFENFLSPGYINASRKTDVDAELERLATELKDTGVMPDRAQKYFTVNKETYAMSQDEYQSHLVDRGQTSYTLVNDFMHDPAYETLSDEERAKVIEAIYDYAAQNAKYHTTEAYERDTWIVEMDDYISRGGDAVDYLTMKAQTDKSTTMSEVGYQRNDLTAAEMGSLILGDVSSSQRAPSTFADPNAKGYVYELNGDQQARYTETYDRLFNERFPELYASEEYRDATPEERKKLVSDLRADVAEDTKYELADWLWEQGVESKLK